MPPNFCFNQHAGRVQRILGRFGQRVAERRRWLREHSLPGR
jgi:hypothetical protein